MPLRPRFRRDERGVSTVVGAMLIFAIGITLLATMKATIVPTQEADAEAAHMRTLSQQLVLMRADIQRQVSFESPADLVHSLQMSRQRTGIFDSGQKADRLGLVFPDQVVTLSGLNVLVEDPSSGASEMWNAVAAAPSVNNVSAVRSLRVNFPTLDKTNALQEFRVDAYNATGAFRGAVLVRVENDADLNYYVRIYTYDATGVTLINKESRAYHNSAAQTNYFLDLLNPAFRFDRVIASAQAPARLTFSSTFLPPPQYAIQYVAYTPTGGGVPLGGGGVLVPSYSRSFNTGFLEYEATNRHFVNQVYRFEHGALVLEQGQGSVFRVEPDFRVAVINNVVGIQSSLPSLRGDARTLASGQTATVRSAVIDAADVTLQGPHLTMSIQTQHPALLRAHVERQLQAAGLSPAGLTPQYTIAHDAAGVTFTVFGTASNPLDPTNDVRLLMRQANVNIKLNP